MKKFNRKCVVCSKKLKIQITDRKGHYTGGYYFSKMELYKKHKDTGKQSKFGKITMKVVKGVGKPKLVEYWECNNCFKS